MILRRIRAIIKTICRKMLLHIKSEYYTRMYSDGSGKIIFKQTGIKLIINKGLNGKLNLHGNLILESSTCTPGYVTINIGPDGIIDIENDFCLGESTKITVSKKALLKIGGKKIESASGITASSVIACNKNITIGYDLICSWNVFITDCNWHAMYKDGTKRQDTDPVFIGNHNWIGCNVIIGPGTRLEDNCIVSAFTKISNSTYSEKSTIGGIIPKIISTELTWSRDM